VSKDGESLFQETRTEMVQLALRSLLPVSKVVDGASGQFPGLLKTLMRINCSAADAPLVAQRAGE
jgi:hypothetical protein